jgi:hypothetical protein
MGSQGVIVLIDDCGNMQIFVGIDATDDGIRLPCTLLHGWSPSSMMMTTAWPRPNAWTGQ